MVVIAEPLLSPIDLGRRLVGHNPGVDGMIHREQRFWSPPMVAS
jgi:hypothetical protein